MSRFLFYDADVIKLLQTEEKPSGGAAVQSYAWIRGLVANGHEVYVITYEENIPELKKLHPGIHFIQLYEQNKGLRWLRWIYYRIPSIYKKLKEIKPDYLYESIPFWGSYFLHLISNPLGIKHIIRLSNDNLLDKRLLKRYSKMHQYLLFRGLKGCDFILCQNGYQSKEIQKRYPEKTILKVYNPFIPMEESEPFMFNDHDYLAWVANFRYQKNLKLLFEIADMMPDEKFLVAGVYSNKPDPETTQYLEKLHQLTNVQFLGYLPRNQVKGFLSKAKFLLNTSRYEGFSNTYLEAMSLGLPILTTNNANPDQIIDQHQIGLIYSNPGDLKEQLDSLSLKQYKVLSENCRVYLQENHNYLQLANKLVQFLESKSNSIYANSPAEKVPVHAKA